MPAPRYRSRSKNQKKVVTPGRITKIHYKKPPPEFSKCAGCGQIIKSMPRLRGPNIRKISKSRRHPSRIYGGFYCPSCLNMRIKAAVRNTQSDAKKG